MNKPLVTEIVRAPKSALRQTVPLNEVQVPNLWHLAVDLKRRGDKEGAAEVLECWHLCHDLLENLRGDIG
jgi:hypothetical protein